MSGAEVFVGIDVAKRHLDLAVLPSGEHWRQAYTEAGLQALVARLRPLQPTLIVLEATGGLELLVVGALAAAGLPVVAINPRQAREATRARRYAWSFARTLRNAYSLARRAAILARARSELDDACRRFDGESLRMADSATAHSRNEIG